VQSRFFRRGSFLKKGLLAPIGIFVFAKILDAVGAAQNLGTNKKLSAKFAESFAFIYA